MPKRSELVDYESVTRAPDRRVFDQNETAADWRHVRGAKSLSRSAEAEVSIDGRDHAAPGRSNGSDRPGFGIAAKSPTATSTFFLKRGHGLSYAGLFLFTIVLYFRPYELVSWLAWTTSSAFIIALLTLMVYVPTQLGLEGKLTIRAREVNLALLLLLAALLSIPLALRPMTAWYGFNDYSKVIVMFIVLVNVVRTEKRLKGLILLSLLVACVLSVSAVNDYRLGRFVLGMHQRIRGLIGNLFDNPNDLALHLVTMIPISIALLLASRGPIKKLLYGACTVLMVCGVVVTFSRAGFFGMAVAVGFLTWRIARGNKWLVGFVLPPVLLLFVLLAPGGYGSRLATTNDESSTDRTTELRRAIFITAHHPLFGVGMGNYIFYADTDHANHNAYMQVASEAGVPAMVVYILLLIAPFKDLRRIARETFPSRRTSQFYYLAIGLEASLIGYMVSSIFASVAFLWYVYYLLGYAICLRRLYAVSAQRESVS